MEPLTQPLKISYYGYLTPMSGYGRANINHVKHLKRLGVDVSVHPKFEPKPGTMEWGLLNDEEKEIFGKPFEQRRIGIIESNPFDFDTLRGDIRVANTMCEADHLAPVWAEKLNSMHYIIVPNKFCEEVFRASGVTQPIKVIPHGVETERFPYYKRPKRDTFTFGIVGDLEQTDRKGAFDLIRAFSSEFDEPDVRLILKSSNNGFGYYSRFTDPRISVITEIYTTEKLNEFYRSLDCFVFPTKAEGVGYPPREAMSTGCPTIVTKWGGTRDIADESISFPLRNLTLKKRPVFIEQDGNWACPDIREIMYQMRYIYENRHEAMGRGIVGSNFIKGYSWKVVSQKLKDFLCTISI